MDTKHGISLAMFGLLVFCTFISTASAATIYVPDNYTKIQWAVDNASDGDTIIVRDGTYVENVYVNKRLTIRSENGSAKTIVQPAGGSVFEIIADYVNISGFSVWGKYVFGADGIKLRHAEYCNISNNNCSNNNYGIDVYYYSNNNIISNNTCLHNRNIGIRVDWSDNNIISNNTCSNNWYAGIHMLESCYNIISNNTCSNSGYSGNGIYVHESHYNIISNNTCSNNGENGIYLKYSDYNTISNNNYLSNKYGGYLEDSRNNKIYLNNFINNYDNVLFHYYPNPMDIWNSTEPIIYKYNGSTFTNYMGNYWDDYVGSDADRDGIGDTPYSIGHSDKDYYPLMEPWENYFKLPEEKIFDNGIWWIKKDSSEPHFGWMKIYLDGEYKGECSRLDLGHKVEGADGWPQVAAIYASGYIRLKECREPDINFGTSFVLGPGYWEGSNYYHNVTIKVIRINSSKPFEIQIKAELPHFNITYDIEMLEPSNESMKMHVCQIYECTKQLTLNDFRLKKQEGFKIVQLSSMYINETHHDSDGAKYIDEEGKLIAKRFEDLKTSQFIFDVPKKFGENWLECTHSDDYGWQGNTPNCIIYLDNLTLTRGECTPQGWITITSNPNDDNIGLWIHHDKVQLEWNVGDKYSVSYWLIAQDDPKKITTYIFDTGESANPYPSIMGNHTGIIKPNHTVIATKLYTYPCIGTGGHTEYARIWNGTWNATATWNGYVGDWHNISFDQPVVLMANETYNYTIRTGSYPQIHHTNALPTTNGWINCTSFVDANGKTYTNWIPAIRLE